MSYLRNSILATLVYYDVLEMPLTLVEIHKFLINPSRVNARTAPVGEITLNDIESELSLLVKPGLIEEKNGFYFLDGRHIYNTRIERNKISVAKWKKFLRLAKFFQAVPYLRGIFASGSLASENTGLSSDFDVLVITKPGRLYICRIFLSAVASFFRARRKRYDKLAPDKFCFNHYLTSDNLQVIHQSLFNAQTYASLNPCLVSEGISDKFFALNLWLNKYLYNFRPQDKYTKRNVVPSKTMKVIAGILEVALNSFVGDFLERIFKHYQQNRIKKNPATYATGGRIIFNDKELEFHPRSFEAVLLDKYNSKLQALGIIVPFRERDSGLN